MRTARPMLRRALIWDGVEGAPSSPQMARSSSNIEPLGLGWTVGVLAVGGAVGPGCACVRAFLTLLHRQGKCIGVFSN